MSFQPKTLGSTTPRPWLWAKLSTAPANRLQNFGSAVPAIIADLIIAAAKNGERNPDRLYEQVLNDYGIDNSSKLARVGRDLPVSAYTSVAQAA